MKNFNFINLDKLIYNAGLRIDDEYPFLSFDLLETIDNKYRILNFKFRMIDENNMNVKTTKYNYEANRNVNADFNIEIGDKTESEVLYEVLSNKESLDAMKDVWQTDININKIHKILNIEFKNKQYFRFIDVADNIESVSLEQNGEKISEVKIYMQLNNRKYAIEVI